ncbi:MAG: NHL repeat-containing protein [Thermodesulfobacteriota bacterium]
MWFIKRLAYILPLSLLVGAIAYAIPTGRGVGSFMVTTIAGSGIKGILDDHKMKARFNWPTGIAVDQEGIIYIADFANNAIRRIGADGYVTTIAGGQVPGFADGQGSGALLRGPDNITIDTSGNLFFADADNFRIRKLRRDGYVTTVAGSGQPGYKDGDAHTAMFGYPTGAAVDSKGNLYVADRQTHTVRRITTDGVVHTIGGNGHPGFLDGKGLDTHLREPISVAVDDRGIVYVADSGNNAIRKITPDGRLSTVAGGREKGYRDGRGKDALFAWPTGIALDAIGNIYVCDSLNHRIRRVTPDGVVSTVAGGSLPGASDGYGYYARFNFPTGIYVDRAGSIYIADSGNNRIRKISQGGIIETRGAETSTLSL